MVGVCGTIQELSSVVADAAGRDGGNFNFNPSTAVLLTLEGCYIL